MNIRNKRLSDEEFFKEREKVLAVWPTGKEVDLNEAFDFQKSLPASKVWARRMEEAKQKGEALIITGMGQTTLEQQINLLKTVEPVADVLGTSIDSLTRSHNFETANREIQKSLETGISTLNGFPLVNHGVAGVRKLVNAISKPIRLKFGAPDIRIILEIAFAGGFTADSGDALYNFWNMNTKEPLEVILKSGQYVHRLVGFYEERGARIGMTVLGMYGCGVPPGLVIAAALTQVLMMAEQGVKLINLHYMAQGNLAQDIAAANTFRKLAEVYLNMFGQKDVELTMSAGLGLARYPDNLGRSFMVTCFDCLLAQLCKAQVVDVRTISEAKTIPTKEDIVVTYKAAKMAVNLFKGQNIEVDRNLVSLETKFLELEVRSILEKVLDLGDSDVAVGVLKAVEQGVLDNPFSTHRSVACRVMGVKDNQGAMRYLDHGNLPLSKEILEFHREKIAKREESQGRRADYQTVVADLISISRGVLLGNV